MCFFVPPSQRRNGVAGLPSTRENSGTNELERTEKITTLLFLLLPGLCVDKSPKCYLRHFVKTAINESVGLSVSGV